MVRAEAEEALAGGLSERVTGAGDRSGDSGCDVSQLAKPCALADSHVCRIRGKTVRTALSSRVRCCSGTAPIFDSGSTDADVDLRLMMERGSTGMGNCRHRILYCQVGRAESWVRGVLVISGGRKGAGCRAWVAGSAAERTGRGQICRCHGRGTAGKRNLMDRGHCVLWLPLDLWKCVCCLAWAE